MAMPTHLFRTLSDPTRCALYERLIADGELNVATLTAAAGVSQSAVSQHLAVLRGAGLVVARGEGRTVFYRATPDGITPIVEWMQRYRDFWDAKIDALDDLLNRMDQ
jgi:DNA-binding transcriptional ArsR family regulator